MKVVYEIRKLNEGRRVRQLHYRAPDGRYRVRLAPDIRLQSVNPIKLSLVLMGREKGLNLSTFFKKSFSQPKLDIFRGVSKGMV